MDTKVVIGLHPWCNNTLSKWNYDEINYERVCVSYETLKGVGIVGIMNV